MPRRDYSELETLENLQKQRTLTAEEKLQLKELRWCKYEKSYKAKPEVHNRIRICDICKEEVPEYKYQNHKLTYHKEPSFCDVCKINVKFYTNHCKTKKHQMLFLFKNSKCINETQQTEILQSSKSNQTTEEAEQNVDQRSERSIERDTKDTK